MSDLNNQQASSWKKLNATAGEAATAGALKSVQTEDKKLIEAVADVIAGYAKDLYGKSSTDDKYVSIVDLILKRLKLILSDCMETIENDGLESFKTAILDALSAKLEEQKVAINSSYDSIIKDILDAIKDKLEKQIADTKNELEDLFSTKLNELAEAQNEEEKENESKEKDEDSSKDEKKKINVIKAAKKTLIAAKIALFTAKLELIAKKYDPSIWFDKLFDSMLNFQQGLSTAGSMFSKISGMKVPSIQESSMSYSDAELPKTDNVLAIVKAMNQMLDGLLPTAKSKKEDKKNKKKATAIEQVLNFMSDILEYVIDRLGQSIDYIFDKTLRLVAKFFIKVFGKISVPFILGLAAVLYLLGKPIIKILAPFLNLLFGLIAQVFDFLTELVDDVIAPLAHFILDVVGEPLSKLIKKLAVILIHVLDACKPHIAFIVTRSIRFVNAALDAMNNFLDGIDQHAEEIGVKVGKLIVIFLKKLVIILDAFASNAETIGGKVGTFCETLVTMLAKFLGGIGDRAEMLGEKLGEFSDKVLGVLLDFFEGFVNQAEQIGKDCATCKIEIMKVLSGLIDLVNVLANDVADALQGIVDFFDGFRTNAKSIGYKLGKYFVIGLEVKNEIMKAMANKAEAAGRYLANGMFQNLKQLSSALVSLRLACGGDVKDDEFGEDQQALIKMRQQLKDLKKTVESLVPGFWSRTFTTQIYDYPSSIASSLDSIGKSFKDAIRKMNEASAGIQNVTLLGISSIFIPLYAISNFYKNAELATSNAISKIADAIKKREEENESLKSSIESLSIKLAGQVSSLESTMQDSSKNEELGSNESQQDGNTDSGKTSVIQALSEILNSLKSANAGIKDAKSALDNGSARIFELFAASPFIPTTVEVER
jgi:hypothetical protein